MVPLCVNDIELQLPRVTLFQVGERKRSQRNHTVYMAPSFLRRFRFCNEENKYSGAFLPLPGRRLLSLCALIPWPPNIKKAFLTSSLSSWEHTDSQNIRSWGGLIGLCPLGRIFLISNLSEYTLRTNQSFTSLPADIQKHLSSAL